MTHTFISPDNGSGTRPSLQSMSEDSVGDVETLSRLPDEEMSDEDYKAWILFEAWRVGIE